METCPLCLKEFPNDEIQLHANRCLDTFEPLRSPREVQEGSSSQIHDSSDVEIVAAATKTPKNAFDALGLKRNANPKAARGKKKKPAGKTAPSLTSSLIAEKRMMAALEKTRVKDEKEEHLTLSSPSRAATQAARTGSQQAASPNTSVVVGGNTDATVPPTAVSDNTQAAAAALKRESRLPLPQRLRPTSLDDFYGQEALVGPSGILRPLIESDKIPSFILWGPPGVGKTSLARIISKLTSGKFVEVSGVDGTTKRLREVFQHADNERRLSGRKTILFLDEIHRFNKAVQDVLLPVIEKGVVTIIGATTENPSFTVNGALLSRMHVFPMETLSQADMVKVINRGIRLVNKTRASVSRLHLINLKKDAIDYIAELSAGDSRVALNMLESVHAYLSGVKYSQFGSFQPDKEAGIKIPAKLGVISINKKNLQPLLSAQNYHSMYDRHGDSHYDTISAFHKSIRGSDPDAAIFYLVKMLSGGEDPLFIIRRLIVMASEDIGLRDSSCLPFAIAAKEALEFIGMPEGEIILAHVTTKFARAPKSTKSYRALRNAQSVFSENPDLKNISIPIHLRNAPTKLMKEMGYGEDYKYNPTFENGKVKQSYLPRELTEKGVETKFVEPTHMGTARDPMVPSSEYKIAESDAKEYEEYKKFRKRQLEEYERRNDRSKLRKTRTFSISDRHSYDENLPRSQQPPDYIDGQEKQEYSDDPDSTNNFECSYDENLTRDVQPRYEEEDTFHYDPEYPIFD